MDKYDNPLYIQNLEEKITTGLFDNSNLLDKDVLNTLLEVQPYLQKYSNDKKYYYYKALSILEISSPKLKNINMLQKMNKDEALLP